MLTPCPYKLEDFDETVDITIQRERGTPLPITVLAIEIAPGLLLSQCGEYCGGGNVAVAKNWYALTHAASGHKLLPTKMILDVAYTVGLFLADKCDWTLSAEEITQYNEAQGKHLSKIKEVVSAWIKDGCNGQLTMPEDKSKRA